jgi:protein TonB
MFEDSLVESCGRIRTRSQRYVAGCLLLELALVTTFILVPYLYPAALPARFLSVPLLAPPPAPAPALVEQRASRATAAHPEMLMKMLLAPPKIPTTIRHVVDDLPPSLVMGSGSDTGRGNGPPGAILPSLTPPPARRVEPQKPQRPPRISAGVAAGQLMAPIRPVYPVIARETRTQGTVVVEATISTTGRIENARAVSGPPLLVHAAVEAVREARYRPFLLNGTPVEVETTIQVVFTLN